MRTRLTWVWLAVAAGCLIAGCHQRVECIEEPDYRHCFRDAALDAGPDGGDASSDAGLDAGDDGGSDAGPCGMTCPVATPVCDTTSGACVECLGVGDCSAPTPLCDTATNLCVTCLANPDCTDPAMPICETGTCRGCTADTDCASIAGMPVCDELSGRCVECTVDTETTTCPAPDNLACHPTDLTCTGAERGTLGFCQACVNDSECLSDGTGTFYCVPMQFMGSPHGTYCLLDQTTITPPCPNQMRSALTATSVLGVESTYCFVTQAVTTCEAVLGFRDDCPGGDTDCGAPGLDDALCRSALCTYQCGGDSDCFATTCVGGAPRFCQP